MSDASPPTERAPGEARTGVVAMTMGGPAEPSEVRPFLRNLFADPDLIQVPVGPLRPVFAWAASGLRARTARKRYAAIGGSPLVAESEAQVAALQSALADLGLHLPVRLAVAYGPRGPTSDVALSDLVALGVRRVLALPLYPQRSIATTGASLRALRAAAQRHTGLEIQEVPPYPTLPGLVAHLRDATREALCDLSPEEHPPVAVLATAHGVPERYVRRGDVYVDHVRQTHEAFARALAACEDIPEPLRPRSVTLAFQSRIGPVRWVGPSVEEALDQLVRDRARSVVVVPLTFVCEHLETRYDLDLSLRERALNAGILAYRRVPAPSSSETFIRSLAAHLRDTLAPL